MTLTDRHYRRAFALALFTIAYNLVEGVISTWFGATDDSLTLFGFGVDSFIEAVSGLGIAHMVFRIRANSDGSRDPFEKRALTITGYAFYALAAGLVVSIVLNIVAGHTPSTTVPGVVISLISIAVMLWLIREKTRVGTALGSSAIIADARCTQVCVYMSLALLASSALYELTGFAHLDSIGAAALAWFSFQEGRECFRKADTGEMCDCAADTAPANRPGPAN
jgi:Kef-type K+ transport system membrane component KefB